MSALAVAAKRSLVHRIKKMLKPVARLVSRSSSSPKPCRVPSAVAAPTEADLDNLANEALEEKRVLEENAANEARVRIMFLASPSTAPAAAAAAAAAAAVSSCCARADADLWLTATTISRCQRAEQQRPL